MFRADELGYISDILAKGFHADQIVKVLKSPGQLDEDKEKTIRSAIEFLESVQKGSEVVNTANISGDAVESIDAYHRALIAFTLLSSPSKNEREEFNKFLSKLRDEINYILQKKTIEPEKVNVALEFFKLIRKWAFVESSRLFLRSKEEWTQQPLLIR